jgi:hypothetical protein
VIFRSSRNPRFVLPRAAAAAVTLTAGVVVIALAREPGIPVVVPLAAGVIIVLAGVVYLASALLVRYELGAFDLVIHHGLWRTRIPLECIEGVLPVRPSAGEIQTLAPHVTVVYQLAGHPRVAILTPDDPEAFLNDLATAAPYLERTGDRLLRKPGLIAVS